MTYATASKHARERALARYGIELSDDMWCAMALSIHNNDAKLLGLAAEPHQARYAIRMLRTDGTEFDMPVVFDHLLRTIVTVLPPKVKRPSKPPPRERSQASRQRHR